MSSSDIEELKQLVKAQNHRIGVLEDIAAIRNLQHAYGYYIDKCHYNEVVELFEEDGVVIFHGGIFKVRPDLRLPSSILTLPYNSLGQGRRQTLVCGTLPKAFHRRSEWSRQRLPA